MCPNYFNSFSSSLRSLSHLKKLTFFGSCCSQDMFDQLAHLQSVTCFDFTRVEFLNLSLLIRCMSEIADLRGEQITLIVSTQQKFDKACQYHYANRSDNLNVIIKNAPVAKWSDEAGKIINTPLNNPRANWHNLRYNITKIK